MDTYACTMNSYLLLLLLPLLLQPRFGYTLPPASSFLAAQARNLSQSAPLGWAKGAPKCYGRNSDGGAAIEILSVSSALGLSLVLRTLLGDRAGWKIGLAWTAMIFFYTPNQGRL